MSDIYDEVGIASDVGALEDQVDQSDLAIPFLDGLSWPGFITSQLIINYIITSS